MIAPDDRRHGVNAGYWAGCRDTCCRRAHARYAKRVRLAALSGGLSISALGSQRRLQALAALGWSLTDIATALGTHRSRVRQLLFGQKGKPTRRLERKTAAHITEVYDRLCMTVPEKRTSARARAWALSKGWVPPLAWNDIDDPDERPAGPWRPRTDQDDYDDAVVRRILARDIVPSTTAERVEVVRRWTGDHNELERLTGWNVQRYIVPEQEIA